MRTINHYCLPFSQTPFRLSWLPYFANFLQPNSPSQAVRCRQLTQLAATTCLCFDLHLIQLFSSTLLFFSFPFIFCVLFMAYTLLLHFKLCSQGLYVPLFPYLARSSSCLLPMVLLLNRKPPKSQTQSYFNIILANVLF